MGNIIKKIRNALNGEQLQCYLMLFVQIAGFLVFTVYPIIWVFHWAFYKYNGIPSLTKFIGLDNFINIFTQDATYWKTWLYTLEFAALKVPIEITLAVFLAVLLTQKFKGSGLFRSMYYVPNVISVAIVGLIFSSIFSYFGVANGLLQKFGIIGEPIDWFANKGTATFVLVLGSIWNTFGVNVMYVVAALSNVSEDIYESADLDGASRLVKFFKITLPMITPVFKIILLLSVVGTLGVNEYVLVLTNGGPSGSTHTVMSYMTKSFMPGFMTTQQPELGYGCALSLITTILFAVVAFIYNYIDKKIENVY